MTKKIIAAFLALCIICCGALFSVSAEEDIASLEERLAELKEEDAKYQEILNSTKEDISEKEAYSEALMAKINVLNEQLSLNHTKSDELDSSIAGLQAEIEEANSNIETQMATLKSRIRTIYMSGSASDLEIILGAKDFGDFLDKLELVKTLSAYDENLISDIKTQLSSITEDKKELEAQKEELKVVESELQSGQAELQSLLDENEALLSTLYSESESLIANISDTDSQQSEVEAQIQAYYAEQKAAAEEAARRQAEAEAAARAAEEEEQNSSYDDPDYGDGDSGYGDNSYSNGGGSGSYAPSAGGGYVWPCPGFYYLSSEWNEERGSYNHGAIDIAGSGIMGAAVVAADSGTVISSNSSCYHNWGKSGSCGCGGGYGNYVWIDHGNGKATIYAHLSSLSVSTGQYVSQGQVLGYVGSTGESTGPHLHFECRYYGEKYNPMSEY